MGELHMHYATLKTGMNKQQVIKELKEILISNEAIDEQQENALIIAIAELLKE